MFYKQSMLHFVKCLQIITILNTWCTSWNLKMRKCWTNTWFLLTGVWKMCSTCHVYSQFDTRNVQRPILVLFYIVANKFLIFNVSRWNMWFTLKIKHRTFTVAWSWRHTQRLWRQKFVDAEVTQCRIREVCKHFDMVFIFVRKQIKLFIFNMYYYCVALSYLWLVHWFQGKSIHQHSQLIL